MQVSMVAEKEMGRKH